MKIKSVSILVGGCVFFFMVGQNVVFSQERDKIPSLSSTLEADVDPQDLTPIPHYFQESQKTNIFPDLPGQDDRVLPPRTFDGLDGVDLDIRR